MPAGLGLSFLASSVPSFATTLCYRKEKLLQTLVFLTKNSELQTNILNTTKLYFVQKIRSANNELCLEKLYLKLGKAIIPYKLHTAAMCI